MPRRFAVAFSRLSIILAAVLVSISAAAAPTRAVAPSNALEVATLPAANALGDFDLLTPQDGWVLLGNSLYATHTGGESWEEITPPDLGQRGIWAAHFLDPRQGWLLLAQAGEAGEPSFVLAVTTDGGISWRGVPLPLFAQGDLDARVASAHLFFVDGDTGWLVFRRATSANFDVGVLFRTTDGGETWTRLAIPIGDPVYFSTTNLGWVAGGAAGDEFYRTRDGGSTWERQDVPDAAAVGRRAYGLPRFEGARRGQLPLVLSKGERSEVLFYATDDGGDSWRLAQVVPLDEELPAGSPLPLSLLDATRWSLVLPAKGRVLSQDQGGEVHSTTSYDRGAAGIVALDMAAKDMAAKDMAAKPGDSGQVGWARYAAGDCAITADGPRCTQETRLLRTEDGGRTWSILSLPTKGVEPAAARAQAAAELAGASTDLTQAIVGQAFDSCTLPSVSQMRNWFLNSPYRTWNLYIGGSSMANCGTLTAAHIAQLAQQGWRLIPTWVGPQAACTTFSTRMSADPATAYAQGVAEANAATDVAASLGLTRPDGTGTMIYYDLEAYDTTNQPCRDAARSFIAGWSAQLRARGIKSGVYGSACSSALADFQNLPAAPDGVWIAVWTKPYEYRPEATVWNLACLANSLWANHQRLRQYSGGHDETWGGLTLNIDSNVLDGIVVALNPPNTPFAPAPADGASAPTSLALRWSGGDPDSGDTVRYRVVLELDANPIATLCEGSSTTCTVDDLLPATDYYWRVIATDQRGMTSSSPVWHFRTTAVANDEWENAAAIAALPFSNVQETVGATVATDDPLLGCVTARKYGTVWYRYTPVSDTILDVNTLGSSYDTVLAVWTGEGGALQPVACNDDAGPGQTGARVRFSAMAGTTYTIEVAGYTQGGGTLRLAVAESVPAAMMRIDPPGRTIAARGVFTVGVQIADVTNLGSYQLAMTYEPDVLQVEAVTWGNFLGRTGRTVTPLGPVIDNTAGRMTLGAFTSGAMPTGPSGTGTLAWVRLRGSIKGSASLHLAEAQAADVTGKAIPLGLRDGAVLIIPCEGDLNGNGEVDAEDVQRVAYGWGAACGQTSYDPFYDLDNDCDIDIADVQRVAGRWGQHCVGPTGPEAAAPETGAAPTVLFVRPTDQQAGVGQTFTVQIAAAGALNLGAMEFVLGYDAEYLELVEARPGSFLGMTGRPVTAVGPSSEAKAGTVTYGLYTLGGAPPGAGGNGVLAQVTFRARRMGHSALILKRAQVTDISGAPAPVLLQAGQVTVGEAHWWAWLPLVMKQSAK